jgi:hypothetical protein
VGELHTGPAALLGRSWPRNHWIGGGVAPEPVWKTMRRETRTRTATSLWSSPQLVAMPTVLPRPPHTTLSLCEVWQKVALWSDRRRCSGRKNIHLQCRRLSRTNKLRSLLIFFPEHGGIVFLRIICELLPGYVCHFPDSAAILRYFLII